MTNWVTLWDWIFRFSGFPGDLDGRESACNAGDWGWLPGCGRPPGGGHDNPLQYSCLENPMDRGAWRAPVSGIEKSWTRVSDYHSLFLSILLPSSFRIHWWFSSGPINVCWLYSDVSFFYCFFYFLFLSGLCSVKKSFSSHPPSSSVSVGTHGFFSSSVCFCSYLFW